MSMQVSEKRAPGRQVAISDSAAQQLDTVFADIQGKWIAFNSRVNISDQNDLAVKIELFSRPLRKVYERTFPQLASKSDETFWLMLLTAVLRSNTHPREMLTAAIYDLRRSQA